MINGDISHLREVFGLPRKQSIECEYQPMECNNLGSDMICHKNDDEGDGHCPGKDQEEDDD